MRNISDLIEQYLKQILAQSQSGSIEIQRSYLANQFACVPSQINYVISTRFTTEQGYIIESKRGGGGFIRIRKIDLETKVLVFQQLAGWIGTNISQQAADGLIMRLREDGLVTTREAAIMMAATSREHLHFPMETRDKVRAELIKAMIKALLYSAEEER